MPVTVTIRTAEAAYEALVGVAKKKEHNKLVNFIIWKENAGSILNLLDHQIGGEMMLQLKFSNQQLRCIAKVVYERGTKSAVMECIARLPAKEKIAKSRMMLLERLLRLPVKVWLKGDSINFNVHPLFRKAKFLPAEVELMIASVKRSKNHEYVDALGDFQPGMMTNDQWEGLQHTAHHFHQLEEKRKAKKAA